MEKLKFKCSKCKRKYSVNLPDDALLREFSVICKHCVEEMEKTEHICETKTGVKNGNSI